MTIAAVAEVTIQLTRRHIHVTAVQLLSMFSVREVDGLSGLLLGQQGFHGLKF
jgi:hypothetical protein